MNRGERLSNLMFEGYRVEEPTPVSFGKWDAATSVVCSILHQGKAVNHGKGEGLG